jgi:hypothetical protein
MFAWWFSVFILVVLLCIFHGLMAVVCFYNKVIYHIFESLCSYFTFLN